MSHAAEKKNEIAPKAPTELVQATRPDWLGRSLSVDTKVPRLLLMQGMSDFVVEEKAKQGDVVRSTNAARVGGMGQPIPMILLSYPTHEWIIEVKPGKKFEFIRAVPRNSLNQNIRWNFWGDEDGNVVSEAQTPDGTPIPQPKGSLEARRVRTGSFFALLPGDMDRFLEEQEKVAQGGFPDLSIEMTPVQVRCRSYSYEASVNVEKMLQKIAAFKCQPYQFVVELSVKKMENDDNAWFVYDFDLRQKGIPTPEKYRQAAKDSFEFVQANSSKLNIDDKEEDVDSTEAPSANGQF